MAVSQETDDQSATYKYCNFSFYCICYCT